MLWPAALSQVGFFNAFHETKELDSINQSYGKMSRFKAFWIAFLGMFVWSWFPAYFAQGLQFVAVLCLIPGTSRTIRFLGSGTNKVGPGILSLTFDWTQITGTSYSITLCASYLLTRTNPNPTIYNCSGKSDNVQSMGNNPQLYVWRHLVWMDHWSSLVLHSCL
jgi:hypothetical protein